MNNKSLNCEECEYVVMCCSFQNSFDDVSFFSHIVKFHQCPKVEIRELPRIEINLLEERE